MRAAPATGGASVTQTGFSRAVRAGAAVLGIVAATAVHGCSDRDKVQDPGSDPLRTNVLAVTGEVRLETGSLLEEPAVVVIRNEDQSTEVRAIVGDAGSGVYAAAFVAYETNDAVTEGDRLVFDVDGRETVGERFHEVRPDEVERGLVSFDLTVSGR